VQNYPITSSQFTDPISGYRDAFSSGSSGRLGAVHQWRLMKFMIESGANAATAGFFRQRRRRRREWQWLAADHQGRSVWSRRPSAAKYESTLPARATQGPFQCTTWPA
jgi:hypothetical protein